MLGKFEAENKLDENGNPSGGSVSGVGLSISWQDGPLGRDEDRKEPNGAFVETLIAATMQRIRFYQTASDGKFACQENSEAIEHLERAAVALNKRTESREKRGVEGTHTA